MWEEYKEILKKINKEEIEEFLLEKMLYNANIRESFEIKFSQYFPKKTKEEYKALVRSSLNEVADRYYISEEMGREALHILYDYQTKIEEFIEKNDIKEAIVILEATLEVIGEFTIDGSYGEHGDIQDDFKELMEKVLEKCSGDEKETFLKWLENYVKVDDEFVDFKDEFAKLI